MAAGDAVVIGAQGFTEQLPQRRWSRGRGWRRVRSWVGAYNAANITALVEALQAANAEEIDVREGWPTEVSAYIPNDSSDAELGIVDVDSVTDWTLDTYRIDRDLATHGKFHGSDVSATVLATIDADIRAGVAYGRDYDAEYGISSNLNAYVRLRGQGVDSYAAFGATLRAVLDCERGNVFVREFQQTEWDQGAIVRWDDLRVPDAAQIEQPYIHMYVPSLWDALPIRAGTVPGWCDVYFDEWLVVPMSVRFVQRGRVRQRQLVKEYIGAINWSATLYESGHGVP